jgi:predicted  nucleic acid-binding Zn-ribbon protein
MQQQTELKKVNTEIEDIKDRLDALTILYKNLLDSLVKTGKMLPDERKALRSKEKILSEKALFDALKA